MNKVVGIRIKDLYKKQIEQKVLKFGERLLSMGKWKKSSGELIEKFHSVMDNFADADRKKMFGYPCCFLRGNMFTGLHEENWVLRLKEEDREAMIAEYGAERFAPMGRLMKEYLILPQAILGRD